MKKVVLVEKKYKTIEDGTKERIIYVSEDGLFKSEEESNVLHYEAKAKFNTIESIKNEFDFPEIYTWYRVKSEEEEKLFKDYQHLSSPSSFMYNHEITFNDEFIENYSIDFPLNEWFSFRGVDHGDYSDTYEIYTFNYLKQKMEKFLKEMENTDESY